MTRKLLKAFGRAVPYVRRVQDGLAAMRTHIAALERHEAALQDRLGALEHDAVRAAERMAAAQRDAEQAAAALQERIGALQARLTELQARYVPSLIGQRPSEVAVVHGIDQAWRDTHGVFLSGWVHAGPEVVRRLVLLSGAERVETAVFEPRSDVGPHYPGLPGGNAAGFSLYLPCDGHLPIVLAVVTDRGVGEVSVALPAAAIAPPEETEDATGAAERFVGSMLERRGTVLELGARIVGSLTQGWRSRFEPACRYWGNDIHPGPGIDIVGDVHALTEHVAPSSLDGVFSVAVLEHLAAPWRAAAEIGRALRIGGETLHVTHQAWPLHEVPNDFFRMSDQALRSLFGPANGFEVLECGMAYPVAIVVPPDLRHSAWLRVPLGRGYGQSFIRARKVAEPLGLADGAALARISAAYPRPQVVPAS